MSVTTRYCGIFPPRIVLAQRHVLRKEFAPKPSKSGRCSTGDPSPDADVTEANSVPVHTWGVQALYYRPTFALTGISGIPPCACSQEAVQWIETLEYLSDYKRENVKGTTSAPGSAGPHLRRD